MRAGDELTDSQLPLFYYGDGETVDPMLRDRDANQKRIQRLERKEREATATDGLDRGVDDNEFGDSGE